MDFLAFYIFSKRRYNLCHGGNFLIKIMTSEESASQPHSQLNSEDKAHILRLLERLKGNIWARRPILGEIMARRGTKTLYDYAKDFFDINPTPRLDKRKKELIDMVGTLLSPILGQEIADGVKKQLTINPLVSTTDHHGPIDHPFFVNSNIISGIPYYETQNPDLKYLVVLSFASVSVNNSSAFPRGILFHGGENGEGPLIRLPILPDKVKMGVVHGMRSFTKEDLEKAKIQLAKKEKSGEVVEGRGAKIRAVLDNYFGTPDVLDEPDLSSQITKINFDMWPKFFHEADFSNTNKSKGKIPDLVYVEIETLVKELLLKHHLKNKKSLIYDVLFDPDSSDEIYRLFDRIPGAFSLKDNWGTYMFWGVDEKLHRVGLFYEEATNRLESDDKKFSYEWSPEGISAALRDRKIFPSMMMCYLLVSLYYGMKCLGGFCQVNDLTLMKDAWRKYLKEFGKHREKKALLHLQTKELGGDGMVLSYLKTSSKNLIPATGIDMLLSNTDTSYEKYIELSKKMTLSETMKSMLPEMYTVLYPIFEREEKLVALPVDKILDATGVYEKLIKEI